MLLELRRDDFTDARTIGTLTIVPSGVWGHTMVTQGFTCFTLEDTVRAPGVKVPGRTAIPFGRYPLRLTFSERFQRVLPLLEGVIGFDGIRIHPGNTAADTTGCILVGLRREADDILDSQAALKALLPHLEAVAGIEEAWIDILDGRGSPAEPTKSA
jgi:hypothetical protein